MRKLLLTLGVIAGAVLSMPSFAAPIITVSGWDGSTTVANSSPSPAVFSANVGTWSVLGTAIGSPPLAEGTLFSNTVDVKTGGAGSLLVLITESGLSGPIGVINFLSSMTSNLLFGNITSVQERTFINLDDSIPDHSTLFGSLLASHTFTTLGTFLTSTNIDIEDTYSITHAFLITATGTGGVNATIDMAVPEPMSLALLGMGLVGLSMVRRKSGVV